MISKKIIICLLVIISLSVLTSCGQQNDISIDHQTEATSQINTEASQSTTVSTTETNKVEIDWTTEKFTTTDGDGYSYEITYKMSPWILLSDKTTLNSAWNEVGHNNSLPGFDSWGLKWDGHYYFKPAGDVSSNRKFIAPMSDMYYCVGQVTVKNITNDWEINSSNERSPDIRLVWEEGMDQADIKATSAVTGSGLAYILSKIFYGNRTEVQADYVDIDPKMTSNNWGPASFVIMAPENFSPNYPNGQFFERTKAGSFLFNYKEKIGIGIFDKDGNYISRK